MQKAEASHGLKKYSDRILVVSLKHEFLLNVLGLVTYVFWLFFKQKKINKPKRHRVKMGV